MHQMILTVSRPGTAAADTGDKHVTVNYSVGDITIHATDGDDMQKKLEATHRRHVDALTQIVEDAVYSNNRKSFDQGMTAL
jgi:hypothetical protein